MSDFKNCHDTDCPEKYKFRYECGCNARHIVDEDLVIHWKGGHWATDCLKSHLFHLMSGSAGESLVYNLNNAFGLAGFLLSYSEEQIKDLRSRVRSLELGPEEY